MIPAQGEQHTGNQPLPVTLLTPFARFSPCFLTAVTVAHQAQRRRWDWGASSFGLRHGWTVVCITSETSGETYAAGGGRADSLAG